MNPLLVLPLGIALAGCFTVLTGTTESIVLNSEPPGATVTLATGIFCTTPCQLEVRKKDPLHLTFTKPGCQTHAMPLLTSAPLSRILLGGYADYDSGASWSHKPNPVFVRLVCEPGASASPAPAVKREAITPASK